MRTVASLVVALSAVALGAVACSSAVDDEAGSDGSRYTATPSPIPAGPTPIAGSSLKLPVPGSKGNRISAADQATVVKTWLQAKRDYYDTAAGYPSGAGAPLSEVATVPCGGSYGNLVCRFYAHMPSYAAVTPNYRGCFSYLANGGLQVPDSLWDPSAAAESATTRAATYAETFDHCLYQDYDKVLAKTPLWSTTEVATNKAKGKAGEIGVVKYMSDDLRAVFKFIMYTWYEPATYDAGDQAAIISAVYSAYTPPATPPSPPRGVTHANATQYIDSMNAYIAANKKW